MRIGCLIGALVLVGCTEPAVIALDAAKDAPSQSDALTSDAGAAERDLDVSQPGNGPSDSQELSWCERLCTGMDEACSENDSVALVDCTVACVSSTAGDCQSAWEDLEMCNPEGGPWVCSDGGLPSFANDSCDESLDALQQCLGPSDPCEPNPCGQHESCSVDADGIVSCSSEVKEWCEGTCQSMKDACPDFMKSVAMCTMGCVANAQGKCAIECGAVMDCMPADSDWVCDPEQGTLPADKTCLPQLMAMNTCITSQPDPCDPFPCEVGETCTVDKEGHASCVP
jgi:hypothetical protein